MFCRICGAALKEGEKHCTNCGTAVPNMMPLSPQSSPEKTTQEEQVTGIQPDTLSDGIEKQQEQEVHSVPIEIPIEVKPVSAEDTKPLYGYEQYDPLKYEMQKQLEQERQARVTPPPPQYPPMPREAPRQLPPPNAYVQHPTTYSYPPKVQSEPKKRGNGPLIVLHSIMFIIIFICLVVITTRLNEIKGSIDMLRWDFNAHGGYYDDTYDYEDDYGYEDPGFSQDEGQNNRSSYSRLLDEYFHIVSTGDKISIRNLIHPTVIEALEASGYRPDEFALAIDTYIDYYGAYVEEYYEVDVYPYTNSEYAALADKLGFDQASIEQYVDVYVGVRLRTDERTEQLWYDFDLIKVQGEWYLVSVW